MINRRQWFQILAGVSCAAGGIAQQQQQPGRSGTYGRNRGRSSDKANGAGGQSPEEVLMRFPGTLKSVSKKQILLETENEQDVIFRRTKRTQFFNGEKEAKEEAAPVGDKIVIEGRRELNGDLDAIHVIWNEKPPAPKESQ